MPGAISAEGLTKSFGDVTALNDVDLHVDSGKVLGLLGPNGAGKTTAVRLLATLLTPDAGTATVAGHDVFADPDSVRLNIGLSGQFAAVDELLTGRENLRMVGELYGMRSRDAKRRAAELLEQFGLTDAADRSSKTYSGGMRRRLDLAAALVVNPPVMFMDEPTAGLDPHNRQLLWEAVESLVASGTTLLLTTQYLEEADRLADNIAVIDHGKVIADGTPNDLKKLTGHERIEVVVHDAAQIDSTAEILSRFGEGDPDVDRPSHLITLPIRGGAQVLGEVIRELGARSVDVDDIGLRRPTLDEVFLFLTGEDARAKRQEAAGRAERAETETEGPQLTGLATGNGTK